MYNPLTSTKKPSGLVMLMISLVALFAVGCGDSRDEYVYNNLPPASPNTGNLTFQFQQQQANAQQAGIVPIGTTTLQFEFFSTTSGSDTDLVHEDTVAYANQVTITGVPASAVFVRVTAYGAGGAPLATFTGTFEVAIGATTPVDLGAPTAVTFDSLTVSPSTLALSLAEGGTDSAQLTLVGNFSNGQTVAFPSNTYTANADFASSDTEVATVSSSGVVQAVGNGEADITATYTLNGVEQSATTTVTVSGGIVDIDTLSVTPSSLIIPDGSTSGALTAQFSAAGGTPVDVTGNVTYTLQAEVGGIQVENTTGSVSVAEGTANGTTATVVGTYTTPSGNSVNDTVSVTVGPLRVLSYQIAPDGDITLPEGSFLAPILILELSNASTVPYLPFTSSQPPFTFEFTSSNPAAINITQGALIFQEDAGNQTATITINVDEQVTTFQATSLDVDSTTLRIVPSTTQTTVGNNVTLDFVLDYENGTTQDLGLYGLIIAFNQVALLPGSTATGDVLPNGTGLRDASAVFHPTGPGVANIGLLDPDNLSFLYLHIGGELQAGPPAVINVSP